MSDLSKETRLSSAVANTLDTGVLIPTALPTLYRLTSIERLPTDDGCRHRATLFHEQAALRVTWTTRHPDVTLSRGCLVTIRWTGLLICNRGEIHVARLSRLDRPLPDANLFATIPHLGSVTAVCFIGPAPCGNVFRVAFSISSMPSSGTASDSTAT